MKKPTLASALKSSCAKQTSTGAVFAFVRQTFARHVKYSKSFHLGFVNSRRPLRAAHKPANPWTGSSMVEQLTLNQRVGGSSPPRFTKFPNKTVFLRYGPGRVPRRATTLLP